MLAAMLLAVQEPEVFFGNLHSHTSYSDGSGTPEEAYAHARSVDPDERGRGAYRAWTAPVWFEAGAGPTEVPLALHIDSLLPNPVGDDSNLEQATIHNVSAEPALMTGWTLRDRTGNVWNLDSLGQLDTNLSKTIVRHGKAMAMNNKGPEVIQLINPDGFVVDEIAYDGAAEGQVILHSRPEP